MLIPEFDLLWWLGMAYMYTEPFVNNQKQIPISSAMIPNYDIFTALNTTSDRKVQSPLFEILIFYLKATQTSGKNSSQKTNYGIFRKVLGAYGINF